jgi:UDP-N-acetylmuramoylalanine--D-glutamate ligase
MTGPKPEKADGRPNLGWADLIGRKVGIYGLGREGTAALAACRAMGVEPVLVDDDPAGREGVLGTGAGLAELAGCEVVILAPGVPRRSVTELAAWGVQLVGGLGLWLHDVDRSRVVCVTGTKGKSTTAAVAGHLLRGLGFSCQVVGNIGRPPFDPAVPASDYWVVEVSSYQAASLALTTPVVGVTSLHPDHLPWHGDLETYYADKLSLCRLPGARLTVANGDSEELRARRNQLGPQVRWVQDDPAASWVSELRLLGVHNRRNALIARELLLAMGVPGSDDDALVAKAAGGFAGLEHRLQVIGEVGGVRFVDDSLSTNVLPTLVALDAFAGSRIALIVGGQDRGIDYAPLATGLAGREGLLVLTVPDNGPRIAEALAAADLGSGVEVRAAADLGDAVRVGYEWAAGDGVVLLSPAAPSFGRFTDYAHRGAAFEAAMKELACD